MDFITSQAGNQMTQNRAREARAPEGLADSPPGRPSLQGGASDLRTGSQVWGLQCTPSSYTVPGQFHQIGSHMALCPPLP